MDENNNLNGTDENQSQDGYTGVMIVGRKQIHMITTQIQDTTAQIHTITTQIQDTTTQILIIIKMDILLMRVRRKSLTVKRKVHFAKSFWYVQRVRYCLAL